MKTFINQQDWLKLSQELRYNLINQFAINKSEGVIVMGGDIKSDGCSQEDLTNGLTISKMLVYLGDDWEKVPNTELFNYLLNLIIKKHGTTEQSEHKGEEQAEETTTGGGKETESVSARNSRSAKPKQPNRKRGASSTTSRKQPNRK